MSKEMDFRVRRTYKLLINALSEIIKEKDFDDITVGELCERAMIRRATFYKHFSNKYDFFAFAVQEFTNKYIIQQEIDCDYDNHVEYLTTVIELSIEYTSAIKNILRSIILSSASNRLMDIVYEALEARIIRRLQADEELGYDLPCRPELLTPMISGVMGRVAHAIIFDDIQISHEEIVKLSQRLVQI